MLRSQQFKRAPEVIICYDLRAAECEGSSTGSYAGRRSPSRFNELWLLLGFSDTELV